jgi:IclR family KDG regulon transcriptional repressor
VESRCSTRARAERLRLRLYRSIKRMKIKSEMPARTLTSVEKAMQLIMALADANQEIGPSELSRKLGMHKATVSRILLQLTDNNFAYRNNETGKFWLGPAIHHLGTTITQTFFSRIVPIARPHIDALRDALDNTVALEAWFGNCTALAYQASAHHPVEGAVAAGGILPINAAAGAQIILAFTNEARVDSLLSGYLEKRTPNTITDKETIKQRLAHIRKRRYAVDEGEVVLGINAIAVPIFDHLKVPIAALIVLIPAAKFLPKNVPNIAARLTRVAKRISNELSYGARGKTGARSDLKSRR